MLYLDYAKPLADGKYILNFFADSVADLESISHGQKFVTKNGTDYGVPQPGSTVVVTSPNSGKTTYVMDAEGIWVVTEDISYSAVVANPSDEATAKLEKLKVNDTTYATGGGKYYKHVVNLKVPQVELKVYDASGQLQNMVTDGTLTVNIINSNISKIITAKDFIDTIGESIFVNYIGAFSYSANEEYSGAVAIRAYSLTYPELMYSVQAIGAIYNHGDNKIYSLFANNVSTITDTVTEL